MNPAHGQHIEDDALLRLAAAEATSEERAAAAVHLAACADCSARLELIHALVADAARLLDAAPAPQLHERRRARSLAAVRQAALRKAAARRPRFAFNGALARAAAVAGILVAAGGAAAAAGPWLASRVQDLLRTEEPAADAAAPTPNVVRGSIVAFAPEGDEFAIEIATSQAGGSLVLRVTDTRSASARIMGSEGELDVVVLPTSLRIHNATDATADYELIVPAHLRTLRVRVGDGPEMVVSPAALGAGWSAAVGLRQGGRGRGEPVM
jgi:hypothetical protein